MFILLFYLFRLFYLFYFYDSYFRTIIQHADYDYTKYKYVPSSYISSVSNTEISHEYLTAVWFPGAACSISRF